MQRNLHLDLASAFLERTLMLKVLFCWSQPCCHLRGELMATFCRGMRLNVSVRDTRSPAKKDHGPGRCRDLRGRPRLLACRRGHCREVITGWHSLRSYSEHQRAAWRPLAHCLMPKLQHLLLLVYSKLKKKRSASHSIRMTTTCCLSFEGWKVDVDHGVLHSRVS